MWKAFASAQAVKLGLSTAALAQAGATGPSLPFVGRYGVVDQVFGQVPADIGATGAVTRSHLKWYPCEFHGQGAVELALGAHKLVTADRVRAIRVRTYELGVAEIADAEKWQPRSRETADHSMPFLVAAALTDRVTFPRGHRERALSASDCREKFLGLTGPVLGSARAVGLFDRLMALPEVDDVNALMLETVPAS